MNRRSFFRRAAAAVVVAAVSPTAIAAPQVWKKTLEWRDEFTGILSERQAERFVELLLDQSVISSEARVVKLPPHRRDAIQKALGLK